MVTALVAVAAGTGAWWWQRRQPVPQPGTGVRVAQLPGLESADAAAGMATDWAQRLLDLALGACDGPAPAAHAAAIDAAARRLERFGAEPGRLPRRPQLLPELLVALNDDTSSAVRIAALVSRDPVLAANLLRLANSVRYRIYPAPVESLERAVALVGMQGMRQLVALALMQPVMRTGGGAFGCLPELLWEHTQYATVAARDHAGAAATEVFSAQLLVLLHGLGAIVVMQALRDEYAARGLPGLASAEAAALLRGQAPRVGHLVGCAWELPRRTWGALDTTERADADALRGVLQRACAAGANALAVMRGGDDADGHPRPAIL